MYRSAGRRLVDVEQVGDQELPGDVLHGQPVGPLAVAVQHAQVLLEAQQRVGADLRQAVQHGLPLRLQCGQRGHEYTKAALVSVLYDLRHDASGFE